MSYNQHQQAHKFALGWQRRWLRTLSFWMGSCLMLCCLQANASPSNSPAKRPKSRRGMQFRYSRKDGMVLDFTGDGRWQLALKGMAFARFEGQTNRADMSFANDDSDGYVASRVRLGIGLRLDRHIGLNLTMQDARFWGSGLPTQGHVRFNSNIDSQFGREVFLGFSLFEGYVTLDRPWNIPLRLEVGRIALEYGRGFVLGDPGFAVQGQSFDTVRLRWFQNKWKVDLFWSKIRATVEQTDTNTCTQGCVFEGDDLVSLYAMGRPGKNVNLDVYAMFYHRAPHAGETPVDSNIAIVGGRLDWHSPRHKVSLEVIGEAGSWKGSTLLAFATLLNANYTFAGALRPTLGLQGMVGSGDSQGNDELNTFFQPLLSRRRRFYGMLGLFAPSNLIQPMLFFALSPHKTLRTSINVRQSFLWSPKDALVSGGHTQYAQNPNGTAQFLGMEINMAVAWKPFPFLSFDLVGGVFLPQVGDYFTQLAASTDPSVRKAFGNEPALLGYFRTWLSF